MALIGKLIEMVVDRATVPQFTGIGGVELIGMVVEQIGKLIGMVVDPATVPQFTGIGSVELIGKLIGTVVDFATVARTHKENCREFARYMKLINDPLKPLRNSELKWYPEARELFDLIEDAARRSDNLAQNCQDWNYFKWFIWGPNIVNQSKEAQNKIDQYLKIIPLIILGIIPLIILGNDARDRKKAAKNNKKDEAMDKKKKQAHTNKKKDEAIDEKKKQARTNKKKDEAIDEKKKKARTNSKKDEAIDTNKKKDEAIDEKKKQARTNKKDEAIDEKKKKARTNNKKDEAIDEKKKKEITAYQAPNGNVQSLK